MSNSLGGVRIGAVGLALLLNACLSTGEPLFDEEPAFGPAPSSASGAAPEFSAGAGSSAATSPTSEPTIGVGGDVMPVLMRDGTPSDGVPLSAGAPAAGAAQLEPAPNAGAPSVLADPCGLDGLILCDSFEQAVVGVFPAADGWLPELPGCGSHSVDGAGPAFSGTRALRGDDGGYPECMLHADSSGESEVFVRTRVYLGGGEALIGQYLSLVEFGVRPDQDDPELRIGVRPTNDSICSVPGLDVTGTGLSAGSQTACTGFVLEPARWYCIEGHLSRSAGTLNLTVSVDGELVIARPFVGSAAWDGSDLFVKVGRAAYGASGSGSVWHDDVAVSRQPTPCGT